MKENEYKMATVTNNKIVKSPKTHINEFELIVSSFSGCYETLLDKKKK